MFCFIVAFTALPDTFRIMMFYMIDVFLKTPSTGNVSLTFHKSELKYRMCSFKSFGAVQTSPEC